VLYNLRCDITRYKRMLYNMLHNYSTTIDPLPWSGLASLQCQFLQKLPAVPVCSASFFKNYALFIGERHATFRAGLLCVGARRMSLCRSLGSDCVEKPGGHSVLGWKLGVEGRYFAQYFFFDFFSLPPYEGQPSRSANASSASPPPFHSGGGDWSKFYMGYRDLDLT
jgi:hypothetical protein